MPKQNTRHRDHNHRDVTSVYRPVNVPLVATHDLVRCLDDAWFGWLPKMQES
ncbi:hypothetical protein QEH34_gp43 [Microbacterium phage Footloose]|uniref:Uncharacterized protein n=1 Tax=Microbacterium phage Footloose TaxID=2836048 RepID=A0A8F3IQD6_9CAUD|nr:hypothetical protein QEH34_gp43 [Microbacterium phage Footloose]QWY84625.1 hypothetical protein SEA_FOOTLOOSE_43 [Microbacterium phage Footloose]